MKLTFIFSFLITSFTFTQAENKKPNIIFLFADDQRADTIGAHGNPYIKTPHLDKMAREGLSFRKNYCAGSFSGAVCVSSRAMLMTGRHWMNIKTNHKSSDWNGIHLLPSRLKEKGNYKTHLVGKWHNGKKTLDQAFSTGTSVYMGGMADHTNFEVQDLHDGELLPPRHAGGFSSTVFADSAIKYIQSSNDKQPFFLYVALMAPHDTRNPPQSYRDYYYKNRPPLPQNYLPEHPFVNGPQTTQGRDESLAAWPRRKSDISDQLSEYYGLITHLDEQVGRILKALKNSEHAKNTIVVYTADHGLAMGSHGLLGKQNIYEQSMSSPLIVKGPNIPKNINNHSFTYIHDMYATLCDYAGISKPENSDSVSLKPIADGKVNSIRDSLFLPYKDCQRSVNDGKWKLHIYPQIDHKLLFNLENDPYEMNNLAYDPTYKDKIQKMTTLMTQWRKDLNDPHPIKVSNLGPKKPIYDNKNRHVDQWQPKWIRDKYFGGMEYVGKSKKN